MQEYQSKYFFEDDILSAASSVAKWAKWAKWACKLPSKLGKYDVATCNDHSVCVNNSNIFHIDILCEPREQQEFADEKTFASRIWRTDCQQLQGKHETNVKPQSPQHLKDFFSRCTFARREAPSKSMWLCPGVPVGRLGTRRFGWSTGLLEAEGVSDDARNLSKKRATIAKMCNVFA